MKTRYNLAVVGYGGMGSWHARFIENIKDLNIIGVYDINEERRRVAIRKGLKVYDTYEELLLDEKVDIILCATPNDSHKEIVIRALMAKKHVICEKPATLTSKDFEEMMEVEKKSGFKLFVHQNRRWDDDYLSIKKFIKENSLGRLVRIESRVQGSRGIPGEWRKLKKHGGGMVYDWGVHLFDQILRIVPCKLTKVFATLSYVLNEEVDDGFTVQLIFENNLVAIVEIGTNNYIKLPRWYILGDRATLKINDWGQRVEIAFPKEYKQENVLPIRAGSGITKTMAPRGEDDIIKEYFSLVSSNTYEFYSNIINCIQGKDEPLVKNSEVLTVLRVIDSVFLSAKLNQVIRFEY